MGNMKTLTQQFPMTAFWMDSLKAEDILYGIGNGSRGETTSPSITTYALEAAEKQARPEMLELHREMPRSTERDLLWEWTYRKAAEGSAHLLPQFDPNGPDGRFAIQADVFSYNDPDKMIAQGKKINSLGRNVFIKIPTTPAGLIATEELLAGGYSVMNTATSSVNQVLAACEAQMRGLARREEKGETGYVFHAVATQLGLQDMCYQGYAKLNGIELSEGAKKYGAIAVAKKAHALLAGEGYTGVYMLSNITTIEHVTEFFGGDIALTLPRRWHDYIDSHEYDYVARMSIPVDRTITDELLATVPFYKMAYTVGELDMDDLRGYPVFCRTFNFFTEIYERSLHVVRDVMLPDPYDEGRAH